MEFLLNRVGGLKLCTDSVREHLSVTDTLFKIFRQVCFTESFQPDETLRISWLDRYVLATLDFITTLLQLGKQVLKVLTRVHKSVYLQLDFLTDALGLNRVVRSRNRCCGFLCIVGNVERCSFLDKRNTCL